LLPVQLKQTSVIPSRTPHLESALAHNTIHTTAQPQRQALKREIADWEILLKKRQQQAAELQALYYQRMDIAEGLVAVVRSAAEDLQTMISESSISLLLPDYHVSLKPLIQGKQIFKIAHIKSLQQLFISLYQAQSESGFFNTELILADGSIAAREIIHIGPFSLLYDGKFLHYTQTIPQPVVLSKSPHRSLSRAIDDIGEQVSETDFVMAPVDLSRGAVLMSLNASVTLLERIRQGGLVAYLIFALGIFALLSVLYKIWTLYNCLALVRVQKVDANHEPNNPLGRILSACNNRGTQIEELEWRIEQAVLDEVSLLEAGFSTIKVLIVAAPMLGLLGTVLGMIETFQAITLFGTSDPRIMAQGISQALVTTLMGLGVAIPLLLLYTWAKSYSKEIRNILEEQSAGLLVERISEGRQ